MCQKGWKLHEAISPFPLGSSSGAEQRTRWGPIIIIILSALRTSCFYVLQRTESDNDCIIQFAIFSVIQRIKLSRLDLMFLQGVQTNSLQAGLQEPTWGSEGNEKEEWSMSTALATRSPVVDSDSPSRNCAILFSAHQIAEKSTFLYLRPSGYCHFIYPKWEFND